MELRAKDPFKDKEGLALKIRLNSSFMNWVIQTLEGIKVEEKFRWSKCDRSLEKKMSILGIVESLIGVRRILRDKMLKYKIEAMSLN